MEIKNRFIQAYRQAPWRIQLQWAGLFLLGLVIAVVTGGIYLNIIARASTAGLEIKDLEVSREETQRKIADLRTKMAYLTSQAVMQKRAEDLGFVDVDPSQVTYLEIKDYPGRQPLISAPLPGSAEVTRPPLIKPIYTQSLWEVLYKGILNRESVKGILK